MLSPSYAHSPAIYKAAKGEALCRIQLMNMHFAALNRNAS